MARVGDYKPIPDDDYDDDDDDSFRKRIGAAAQKALDARAAREALSTTQPFEPGQASTPYNRGEGLQMQTMHQEHAGLPSYAETSFVGVPGTHVMSEMVKEKEIKTNPNTGILDISVGIPGIEDASFIQEFQNEQKERAIRFIKDRYPQFNEKNLVIGFSKKKPLILVSEGPRKGETEILLKDGRDFQQSFLNQTHVKKALGRPAETAIKQASDQIRKLQKEREKLRQDQARLFEAKEAKEKEELDLKRRIQEEEEKRQQLHDDPDVLEQKDGLIKNLKKDLKAKQKENALLQKNYEDSQKKTQEIGQLDTSNYKKNRKEIHWKDD